MIITKQPNQHEVSLSKFYGVLAHHVSSGYVRLGNGVVVTESTHKRLREGDFRTRKMMNLLCRITKRAKVKRLKA